jgi:hypothetical protein
MTRASRRSPAPPSIPGRVAIPLEIEREWFAESEAMAAALRVVLGLPRVLPSLRGQEPT